MQPATTSPEGSSNAFAKWETLGPPLVATTTATASPRGWSPVQAPHPAHVSAESGRSAASNNDNHNEHLQPRPTPALERLSPKTRGNSSGGGGGSRGPFFHGGNNKTFDGSNPSSTAITIGSGDGNDANSLLVRLAGKARLAAAAALSASASAPAPAAAGVRAGSTHFSPLVETAVLPSTQLLHGNPRPTKKAGVTLAGNQAAAGEGRGGDISPNAVTPPPPVQSSSTNIYSVSLAGGGENRHVWDRGQESVVVGGGHAESTATGEKRAKGAGQPRVAKGLIRTGGSRAGAEVARGGARLAELCQEDKAKVARLMQASYGASAQQCHHPYPELFYRYQVAAVLPKLDEDLRL